ncbi:hypothetical protein NL676_018358 [Syzygium grande]|nr:hypothetical protein NL676_018358 [Syzygium grande]
MVKRHISSALCRVYYREYLFVLSRSCARNYRVPQKWKVIGKLPYYVKTSIASFWDSWLYFTSGQRD